MRNFNDTLRYLFVGIGCLLVQATANAQNNDVWDWSDHQWVNREQTYHNRLELNVENDSLLLKRDDGFYTSGLQLNWHTFLKKDGNNHTQTHYTVQLGQELYTASDINIKPEQLSPIDHPYAGWLYYAVQKKISQENGYSQTLGVKLGCLGPCAGGERTQTTLHRILHQPLPQAWRTQIQNVWGAHLNYSTTSPDLFFMDADSLALQTQAGGQMGNLFAYADVAATLKWGKWNQYDLRSTQHYVSLGVQAKRVIHNASIQGKWGGTPLAWHQDIHIRPWVGEVEMAYQYQTPQWGVHAALVRRSSEIQEISQARGSQNFARIAVNRAW